VRYRLADSFHGRDVELTAEEVNEGAPVTSPPGWTKPLPRTYQWRFVGFEPKPADASDWWEPQSAYDVTLGYTSRYRRRATDGKWTSSSSPADRAGKAVGNVQDGSLASCWAEGAAGPGVGEWVEARFKKTVPLRELRILPGNHEYLSAFSKYARPKTLRAVFSDGSSTLLRLKDAPALQRFPVDVTTRTVRLVIESVYLGTDYPGTCIAEVEFGTEIAPGYTPFRVLIDDPGATGRLAAWAGPTAPAPLAAARAVSWQETSDAESVACGDLIGVSQYGQFPADEAPFKEPASLADVTERNSAVSLPDRSSVGEPAEVNALSYWTYEVRYASGVDLLVNTRISGVPGKSVLAELADEAEYMCPYEDGRRLPYELRTIGHCVVGVARPGTIVPECSESSEGSGDSRSIPGQVFWRGGDASYHLYARSDAVTTEELVGVAQSLIEPGVAAEGAPEPASATWPWWVVGGVAAAAVAAALAWLALRRKRPNPLS